MHRTQLIIACLLLSASLLPGQTVGGMHMSGMAMGTGTPPPPPPPGGFSPSTSLKTQTTNNASAVPTRTEVTDQRAGVLTVSYNPNPGNVSTVSVKNLLYAGATTKVFAAMMGWFYDDPTYNGGAGTCSTNRGGTGNWGPLRRYSTYEAGHYCVGYVSSDAARIHQQVDDMIARGFDGVVYTWNGVYRPGTTTHRTTDNTVLALKADLEARCSGGVCPFTFVLMPDNSSLSSSDGYGGIPAWSGCCSVAGTQATSFLNKAKDDICYANKTYFGSPAYLKIDGLPIYMPFWSLSGTDLNTSMATLTTFADTLSTSCPSFKSAYSGAPNNGVLGWYFGTTSSTFSGKYGLAYNHASGPINGGFLWEELLSKSSNGRGVQAQTTNTVESRTTADGFYTAAKTTDLNAAIGGVWAGFDDQIADWSDSCGNATCSTTCTGATYPGGCTVYSGRIADHACGTTWLNSFARINAAYSAGTQLRYVQAITWNDYDEGTAIEGGIDNCYTVTSPAVVGGNFNWTMSASSGAASTATIDHFTLYLGDGAGNLAVLQDGIANTATTVAIPTSSIPSGTWSLYLEMVGVNSILNRMSAGVTFIK